MMTKNEDMKLYGVISRTVKHDMGIDWIYPNIMTNNYEEAEEKFNEEKISLQKKLGNNNVIITQDENRMFEVTYDDFSMRRYVKIIDLF